MADTCAITMTDEIAMRVAELQAQQPLFERAQESKRWATERDMRGVWEKDAAQPNRDHAELDAGLTND